MDKCDRDYQYQEPTGRRLRIAAFSLAVLGLAVLASSTAAQASPDSADGDLPSLTARQPLPPIVSAELAPDDLLIVKFRDDLKVRSTAGTASSRTGASVVDINTVLADFNATVRPLVEWPEEKFAALERRAALRSGKAQPDLAGIMLVEAGGDREALRDALADLPEVEYVYFTRSEHEPPCVDIAPETGSFVDQQDYRGPNPGLNFTGAAAFGDASGDGVQVSDAEYGFYELHEDLCGVDIEDGHAIDFSLPVSYIQHGTAVLGILVGLDNEYGVTGLVPEATARFYPEVSVQGGSRRHAAVASAINNSDEYDVVVLEMQAAWLGTGRLAPAEVDPTIWLYCRTASNADILVVAAAGNGDEDLDSNDYGFYRGYGDSGALIIGAGSADTNHNKLSFSSYGERVNIHAWGESVVSTGYGWLADLDGSDVYLQDYTDRFGGTSSATALMGGALTAMQSLGNDIVGRGLRPQEMRILLSLTGIPQGTGGNIGPFPDLGVAASYINRLPCQWVDFDYDGTFEIGTLDQPHDTLQEAVDALLPGLEKITLKPGTSSETLLIDRKVNIRAIGGPVLIGR
jgi:hypothetical protein